MWWLLLFLKVINGKGERLKSEEYMNQWFFVTKMKKLIPFSQGEKYERRGDLFGETKKVF